MFLCLWIRDSIQSLTTLKMYQICLSWSPIHFFYISPQVPSSMLMKFIFQIRSSSIPVFLSTLHHHLSPLHLQLRFNQRVLLCFVWILASVGPCSYLITKCEGIPESKILKQRRGYQSDFHCTKDNMSRWVVEFVMTQISLG